MTAPACGGDSPLTPEAYRVSVNVICGKYDNLEARAYEAGDRGPIAEEEVLRSFRAEIKELAALTPPTQFAAQHREIIARQEEIYAIVLDLARREKRGAETSASAAEMDSVRRLVSEQDARLLELGLSEYCFSGRLVKLG